MDQQQLTFESFPKIPRLFRDIMVTEKIDGTNAQIIIPEDPAQPLVAGSRNRFITPGKSTDNYGFAAWVAANDAALRNLGPGRHYGEWYGAGIGDRDYGLAERRFALFNHARFKEGLPAGLPRNVELTPVLYEGPFSEIAIINTIATLRFLGSQAVPGFMSPEGIVVYHKAAQALFKYTLDGDAVAKPKTPSPIENP